MRIEFTVDTAHDSVDVALHASLDTTTDVIGRLLATTGIDTGSRSLWCAGDALAPNVRLLDTPLRTGGVLTVGARPEIGEDAGELVSLRVIGGPSAGRTLGLRTGQITIGRSPTCDVALSDTDASRVHATIEVSDGKVTLNDEGSTNGTSVDGINTAGPTRLYSHQVIQIGDSFLTVAGPTDTPATLRQSAGSLLASRPSRRIWADSGQEIELPRPPDDHPPRRLPLLAAVLPTLAGVGFAWAMHAPQFLFFALLSPVMLLATSLGDVWHGRRSTRRSRSEYAALLASAHDDITRALSSEQRDRRMRAPDPAAVEEIARLPGSRLWERQGADHDLLSVRLGLADLPSTTTVRQGTSVDAAGTAIAVPAVADLRNGALGLAGPGELLRASARWLVGQLCTLHSPMNLEIALLIEPARQHDWHWARWLPHLRGRVATTLDEWSELVATVVELADHREVSHSRSTTWNGPWLVVLVDVATARTDIPSLATLLERGPRVGITAIWLDESGTTLPPGCRTVARVRGDSGSRALVHVPSGAVLEVVLDQVAPSWAERVSRALAPLVDADGDPGAGLPDSCSLTEALGIGPRDVTAIEVSWRAADDGCATVLGMGADGPLVLDLVRDGPHALVAGTTGSGKSELLQALVVGLAIAYPPDEMSFLLFDYKGGAAFAECADLPHTAGLVTDLDPHLTRRALQTLEAELLRRERVLAEAGAVDLATYRRAGEPLPRLVLVVDEFAALADELPEFVNGLVSIAQRGRSLGLHLVLATQRPGAAVSPEIRANTNIRICLRVTDASESVDVIDVPDAALIDRRLPGRAFVRIGQSVTPFQVASVGMPAALSETRVSIERLGPWRRPPPRSRTVGARELTALTETVRSASASMQRAAATRPWCEPLPAVLSSDDLPADANGAIAIGLVDLPRMQRQQLLTIDLAHGSSVLLTGRSQSGRSTALCSAAIRASQQLRERALHVHVIDAAGGLAALQRLPHCTSYLPPGAPSAWAVLVRRLAGELERRRQWLADHAYSGASEAATAGQPMPSILVVVDGWDAFASASEERDSGRTNDLLLTIARGCAAAAMSVVISGGRTTLSPRISTAFTQRYLLAMTDDSDFAAAGISQRDVPSHMPPGRALRGRDGAEVQFAFVGTSPCRAEQDRVIAAIPAVSTAQASDAIRIRPLPTSIALADLKLDPGRFVLGVGGDDASPVRIDVAPSRLLVAGPPRSGRTSTLRTLLRQVDDPARAVVVGDTRSQLAVDARAAGVTVISPRSEDRDAHPPVPGTMLLVDDMELCEESWLGDTLLNWMRDSRLDLSVVAAGRIDDVASAYRGLAHELRRHRCALLLQPGPVDGDIVGVRLPRDREVLPPGRGVLVGLSVEPSAPGEPLTVQVAKPE